MEVLRHEWPLILGSRRVDAGLAPVSEQASGMPRMRNSALARDCARAAGSCLLGNALARHGGGAGGKSMQTPGLIVAPLTPFTADLAVDEPGLQRQIDYVITEGGATMVVAAGVETQEYTYLSLEQRRDLIRRTVEFVAGRVPVMVGISHPSF